MSRSKHSTTSSIDHDTYADYLDVLEEVRVDVYGAAHPFRSARLTSPSSAKALDELLPAAVIAAHSEYSDWEELASGSSYAETSLNDKGSVSSMPQAAFDAVVTEETDFESGKALIKTAINHFLEKGGD